MRIARQIKKKRSAISHQQSAVGRSLPGEAAADVILLGGNLITMDHFLPDAPDAVRKRPADPAAAIAHAVRRHEFRADTTWTGQPWVQFLVAGLSLAAFGSTTLAARAPFALAGVLAVLLFLRLVLREAPCDLVSHAQAAVPGAGSTRRRYTRLNLPLLASVAAFLRWRMAAASAQRYSYRRAYFRSTTSFWPGMAALFSCPRCPALLAAAAPDRRDGSRAARRRAADLLPAAERWESTLGFASQLTGPGSLDHTCSALGAPRRPPSRHATASAQACAACRAHRAARRLLLDPLTAALVLRADRSSPRTASRREPHGTRSAAAAARTAAAAGAAAVLALAVGVTPFSQLAPHRRPQARGPASARSPRDVPQRRTEPRRDR
jgi:hypothetical protein